MAIVFGVLGNILKYQYINLIVMQLFLSYLITSELSLFLFHKTLAIFKSIV